MPGERVDARPPPMARPVPLWRGGKVVAQVDAATADLHGYVLLNLGDAWTPYIFTERGNDKEPVVEHPYRATYLALADGRFANDRHGERAKHDKYLELYGIPPTLSLLRRRFSAMQQLACAQSLDLTPYQSFEGFISYQDNTQARFMAQHVPFLQSQVQAILQRAQVTDLAALDVAGLPTREQRYVREYQKLEPRYRMISAVQDRLACEGFLKGKGKVARGGLDWATHEALAEFERRHRVYGWGYIGHETLAKLRQPAVELEHEAVVRVLTERAMHAAGVIEDGSTSQDAKGQPRTFVGADGKAHAVPNLEAELQKRLVAAFGLHSPAATLAWLQGLGDFSAAGGEHWAAIDGPKLPEYYDGNMDLSVTLDRGDVWYEFPFDDQGKDVAQPVSHRPRLTIFTRYRNQRIALARFGTTIGGWRSEIIDGQLMWKYKGSPFGPVVWHQVVSAPVWLPPEGTPPRDLLMRVPGKQGAEAWQIDYDDMGPSYASAYGLVAAYHIKYFRDRGGVLRIGGDEGIRTHGSVDYMSIMRRHSHGCHRLHNHLAVRLMSFVLAHRPHRREGAHRVGLRRVLQYEGYSYPLELNEGGYVFQLDQPIMVDVLEGRIQGRQKAPIFNAIPKYNTDAGAYFSVDSGAVSVDFRGNIRSLTPAADVVSPDAAAAASRPDAATATPRPDTGVRWFPPGVSAPPAAGSATPRRSLPWPD